MKKYTAQDLLENTVKAFLVGCALILLAPLIGDFIGNLYLKLNGGAMDTVDFTRIIESSTTSFNTLGFVISLIGGFGILISGYTLYNNVDNNLE